MGKVRHVEGGGHMGNLHNYCSFCSEPKTALENKSVKVSKSGVKCHVKASRSVNINVIDKNYAGNFKQFRQLSNQVLNLCSEHRTQPSEAGEESVYISVPTKS